VKLYELTQNYLNLLELLENPDIPKEMIKSALKEVEGNFEDKADNITKLIRSLEADIKGYKNEEDRLSTRRKTLENKVKSLKEYLQGSMKALGKEEVKAKLFTLKIQTNQPSLIIDDIDKLPKAYKKTVEESDNKKIKEDLLNKVKIPGARLERTESLRIR
jgi:Siphovirus Gp157